MKFHFQNVVLLVSDINRSLQFYRDTLKLKVRAEPRTIGGEGTGTSTLIGIPGARLTVAHLELQGELLLKLHQFIYPEGKKTVEDKACDVGSVFLSFAVDDMLKTYKELSDRGVRFVNPPVKNSVGDLAARFYDPDGYTIVMTGPAKG